MGNVVQSLGRAARRQPLPDPPSNAGSPEDSEVTPMLTYHGLALAVLFVPMVADAVAEVPGSASTPGPRPIDPRGAIEPAAPVVPAEVVAAMQEGRFGPAEDALARLAAEASRKGDKAYYGL